MVRKSPSVTLTTYGERVGTLRRSLITQVLVSLRGAKVALLRQLQSRALDDPHPLHQSLPGHLHHLHHLRERRDYVARALQPASRKSFYLHVYSTLNGLYLNIDKVNDILVSRMCEWPL